MQEGGVCDQWPLELQMISSGPDSGESVNPSRQEKWTLSLTLCLTLFSPPVSRLDDEDVRWPVILVATCFLESKNGSIAGHSTSGPRKSNKKSSKFEDFRFHDKWCER